MKKKGGILLVLIMIALFSARGLFRHYYFVIPIEFLNAYQIPCTSVEIEGNRYQVEIDLGAKTALSLRIDVLEKLKKDPCGTSRRIDFRGNQYETSLYLIPEVKVGGLLLKKIKAKEESIHFATKASVLIEANEPFNAGRIGRDFFLGKNIGMDFGHCTLVACSQLKDLRTAGYAIHKWRACPFKSTADGIVLEFETDMGKRKFVLDTGATVSVFKWQEGQGHSIKQRNGMEIIETSKFAIDGIDLGHRVLYLLEMAQEFKEIDGLLGMDFLKEYLLYLDFTKETAYIGKSAEESVVGVGCSHF